jgi:hypothetical protein
MLAHLQTLADTVIIITHLKNYYVENRKVPGVQVPRASSTFDRIPRFRIWLRHNPTSPIPIGLVLKRLDKKVKTDRGLRTVSVLPRKIVPNLQLPEEDDAPKDRSLWDTIYRYMDNPIGNREPLPEETPNTYELSILDGILTEEQKINLRLALAAAAKQDESILAENEAEAAEKAKERKEEAVLNMKQDEAKRLYITEGTSYADIAKETGLTVPQVISAVKE